MFSTVTCTYSGYTHYPLAYVIAHGDNAAFCATPHQLHARVFACKWVCSDCAYNLVAAHVNVGTVQEQETVSVGFGRIEHRILVGNCVVDDSDGVKHIAEVTDFKIVTIILIRTVQVLINYFIAIKANVLMAIIF